MEVCDAIMLPRQEYAVGRVDNLVGGTICLESPPILRQAVNDFFFSSKVKKTVLLVP